MLRRVAGGLHGQDELAQWNVIHVESALGVRLNRRPVIRLPDRTERQLGIADDRRSDLPGIQFRFVFEPVVRTNPTT